MYFWGVKKGKEINDFAETTFNMWKESAEASLKGVSLDSIASERFDGMPLPFVVDDAMKQSPIAIPSSPSSLRDDLGNAWEIQQSFADRTHLF